MSLAPLKLGALGTTVAPVVRSGIRWIHDDGHACRAHDIVGWCNVRVGEDRRSQGGHRRMLT